MSDNQLKLVFLGRFGVRQLVDEPSRSGSERSCGRKDRDEVLLVWNARVQVRHQRQDCCRVERYEQNVHVNKMCIVMLAKKGLLKLPFLSSMK